MNKYKKWYDSIVQNRKQNLFEGYTENHHIIPSSLGGTDTADNRVNLSAREHFICHWLLTKMYTGQKHHKMLNALRALRQENSNQKRYKTKITARVYANLKEEYSILQSERMKGENNPMYGDKFYRSEKGRINQATKITGELNGAKQQQARKKIAASKKGKKREAFSKEWTANMSKAGSGENNSMFNKNHKASSKILIGLANKDRVQLEEERAMRSKANKKAWALRGGKQKKKYCPHCHRDIAVNTYPRFHGEKCKSKKSTPKSAF